MLVCTSERHTDAGVLTILLQDNAHSALQVYSGSKEDFGDGEWVNVDPVPGALTVNIGDMLQVRGVIYAGYEERMARNGRLQDMM